MNVARAGSDRAPKDGVEIHDTRCVGSGVRDL
jgi:hypothetical protein